MEKFEYTKATCVICGSKKEPSKITPDTVNNIIWYTYECCGLTWDRTEVVLKGARREKWYQRIGDIISDFMER